MERSSVTGWSYIAYPTLALHLHRAKYHMIKATHEVVLIADAIVEVQLLNTDRRREQSVIHDPERCAGCIGDAGGAVTGNGTCLTGMVTT
jgi:hypothetical protein